MGKWARCLLVLAVLILVPRVAAAQPVLVARPPASDPTLFEAFGWLCAELELQEFEVVVLDDQAAPSNADDLERASQERRAFAAIALQRHAGSTTAEILIVDRVTGKATTRKLLIDPSPNGPTLLAVRAADLLRASLVELAPGERPPSDVVGVEDAPPPLEVVRFTQEETSFQLRAGGVALLTPELGFGAGPTRNGAQTARIRAVIDTRAPPSRRSSVDLRAKERRELARAGRGGGEPTGESGCGRIRANPGGVSVSRCRG